MRKPRKGAVAVEQPLPTVVEFLLDETGSMVRHLEPTIGGYNDFLAEQRIANGLCMLTLTKFESRNFVTPYTDVDVRMVPDLTRNTFIPGGGTPLRDAILLRIGKLRERLQTWDIKPHVLFVVMTDGDDNASGASEQAIRNQIERALEDGWTPIFMGATANALSVAQRLGFPPGNAKSFAAAEMRQTLRDMSAATTVFRAATASAATMAASRDFFAQRPNDWVDPYHRRLHTSSDFSNGR